MTTKRSDEISEEEFEEALKGTYYVDRNTIRRFVAQERERGIREGFEAGRRRKPSVGGVQLVDFGTAADYLASRAKGEDEHD